MKTAFLLVTHILSKSVIGEFRKRVQASEGLGDCFIVFHRDESYLPPAELQLYPHLVVSNRDLADNGLHTLLKNQLVPGSNHFLPIYFAEKYTQYDFYFVIEYDVRFTGDWRKVFEYLADKEEDFFTCHIRRHACEPDWPWWASISHPAEKIETDKLIRSFNPIYRISRDALKYIGDCHRDGWKGHHEVLLPTLLSREFTIRDFGGGGEFVHVEDIGKFYRDSSGFKLEDGSVRWRPSHALICLQPRNLLVHPVKSGQLFASFQHRFRKLLRVLGANRQR